MANSSVNGPVNGPINGTINATTFSLEGKGLKLSKASDVEHFATQILEQDNLEVFILSGNTIGTEAAQALAAALKHKNKIKTVNLSDVFTGRLREEIPPAVKAICDALEDKEHLIELNLSDNAFGPAGAEPMVDFLANQRSLQVLRLNNNGLGVGGGTMIAKALLANAEKAKAENRVSSLRTFVSGRNRLEDGSSKALADAFAAHGTLVEIVMPQNGIRSDGIKNLAAGLAMNPNLELIDLQDNTFVEKGSRALANALPNWPNLKRLNIGDCLLSKAGGLAIAQALELGHNNKLQSLSMSYGEVESDAIIVLAGAISLNLTELSSLDINGNKVKADHYSITQVVAALKANGFEEALHDLDDMEGSDDDEEGGDEDGEESTSAKEVEENLDDQLTSKLSSLRI
jgi:Ran GTPase-activating protein 1